jgi:Tfp pilus assembly protein PilO
MKLTKREVILITLLLVVALIYGTYTFLAKPLQERYFKLIDERASVEQQEMDLNLKLAQKPNLEKRVAEIKDNIGELSPVVIDPLVPELISNYLLDQLADSNLIVDSISMGQVSDLGAGALAVTKPGVEGEEQIPAAPAAEGETPAAEQPFDTNTSALPEGQTAKQMSISISLSGNYSEIYQFLARLEDENRAVDLDSISLGSIVTNEDGTDTMLAVSANLNYYELELPDGYAAQDDPYTRPAFRLPEGKDQPFG